nr:MAG TPA: Alginate and motility regulator [Caudoviricetes sp.]
MRGEIMAPKAGRPKSENPKDVDVKVRFDKELNAKLLQYCQKHDITRTEAIRRGVHLLLSQEK